jgi:hypothetical protein
MYTWAAPSLESWIRFEIQVYVQKLMLFCWARLKELDLLHSATNERTELLRNSAEGVHAVSQRR